VDDGNPYASPRFRSDSASNTIAARHILRPIFVAWTIVFALNLVVPGLLGWSFTRDGGRIGMVVAVVLSLLVGGWVCAVARRIGLTLVVGGAFVAASQFVPLLQVVAGLIGVWVGAALGQVNEERVFNEFSGFLVTMTTGSLLMGTALVAGLAIQAVTPRRWWHRETDAVQ
jgi:hypothetical protein